MSLKVLFTIFISLLVQTANANVRVIGNGGGFAEMQAVHLDQQLPVFLKASQQYSSLLTWLNQNPMSFLAFSPECHMIDENYVKQVPHTIPSCVLYTDVSTPLGSEPKSLREISATVFALRYLQFDPHALWAPTYQKGLELFNEVQLEQKMIPLTMRSLQVASVHIWKIHSSRLQNVEQQLTLELPQVSIDILEAFGTASKCPTSEPFDISYLSIQWLKNSSFSALGPVNWSCGGKSFQGELHLTVENYNPEAPLDTQVQMEIVGRRQIKP